MFTTFEAAPSPWRVVSQRAIRGEDLPAIGELRITTSATLPPPQATWRLLGVASNLRYTQASEKISLDARPAPLGRAGATRAVLIPISKSEAWWKLPQDARRAIFEEQSQHISGSMKYLPSIARKLYHSRDLGEPFDFLTWFEFEPQHTAMFDELLEFLRSTKEWQYVTREVDVRLVRE